MCVLKKSPLGFNDVWMWESVCFLVSPPEEQAFFSSFSSTVALVPTAKRNPTNTGRRRTLHAQNRSSLSIFTAKS